MNPEVITRILIWIVIITLLVAAAGLYRGDFGILRWLVSLAGIVLSFIAYRSRKIYWILGFIGAVILFNPVVPIYLHNAKIWQVLDLVVAIVFGVFLWLYYDTFGKGYKFESHVASLFPRDIWVVVDKTRDFSKILKRTVESDSNPDFTFRHIGTGKILAVECKYRSYFFKGGIDWDKRKGENYREYGRKQGMSVFVVIGVGGSPKKPARLFFCPLERLNDSRYSIIREEELRQFERNSRQSFTSIPL
ncbi:MAG: hypothetical protein HYV13_00685 [Candidatus Doudnabacteria bacterium]|nr:hypothetical protein [Candidatus Doudnabacteria bacterium]